MAHPTNPPPAQSASPARIADAAKALLELAAAREQATIETLGVVPFDHVNGRPRTTIGDRHVELLDAVCEDDEPTLVDVQSWAVSP